MAAKPASPKLSVIGSPPTGFEPSSNSAGAKLWRRVQAEHQFTRSGDLELLRQACIMTDRAEILAEQIAADGPVFTIGHVPKSHPALKDEVAARSFVVRTLMRLGVVGDPDEEKRLPGRPATGAACGVTYEQLQKLRGGRDPLNEGN